MSVLAAAIDGLVAVLTDAAGVGAAGVRVVDGPEIVGDDLRSYVAVGRAADVEDSRAATSRQDWRTIGGASANRDETVTVPVTVVARSGDPVATVRATALTLAEAVEDALRADYTLDNAAIAWAEVVDQTLHQVASANGSLVYVELTVSVKTVI